MVVTILLFLIYKHTAPPVKQYYRRVIIGEIHREIFNLKQKSNWRPYPLLRRFETFGLSHNLQHLFHLHLQNVLALCMLWFDFIHIFKVDHLLDDRMTTHTLQVFSHEFSWRKWIRGFIEPFQTLPFFKSVRKVVHKCLLQECT